MTDAIGRLRAPRVLIVDDDGGLRDALSVSLQTLGFQVRTAEDGEEGLAALRAEPADVVLMDIYMPRSNGILVLRALKAEDPCLPVVMMTGYPTVDMAVRAMKDGASDFLIKPFQTDAVVQTISRVLERSPQSHGPDTGLAARLAAMDRDNEALRQRVRVLSAVHTLNDALDSARDTEELLRRIVETAAELTSARVCSLMLADREAGELRVRAALGLGAEARSARTALDAGVPGRVAAERRPIGSADLNGSLAPGSGPHGTSSFLCLPMLIKEELFGVLNVAAKDDGIEFTREDRDWLVALVRKAGERLEQHALYESIYGTLVDTLKSLVNSLEAKDPYTRQHSQRVTNLSLQLAEEMGCTQTERDVIGFAAFLHDIGKIGVSDAILQKPGVLTPEEYALIKAHPLIGARIVEPLRMLRLEKGAIRHHHERWDGSGYPDGLRGEQIPVLARIVTVADAYDAIAHDRPYRKGAGPEGALRELERCAGVQFDQRVVQAIRRVVAEGRTGD
ncbi:MAG: response regulator [Deltaproteobacteria bacterium]|nr:response regulator [Deltaproteobacteria bacterium]